jgi:hypothetical protein
VDRSGARVLVMLVLPPKKCLRMPSGPLPAREVPVALQKPRGTKRSSTAAPPPTWRINWAPAGRLVVARGRNQSHNRVKRLKKKINDVKQSRV